MNEKEHMLEVKNREILHLRMANEELSKVQSYNQRAGHNNSSQASANFGQVDGDQRGKLVADLGYSIDQLRTELTKVKQSMFAQIGKYINFDV